ncbi:MAG TPA: YsnF/AvaK domain-containing protein [Chloroflexia bacterium]|nr:YsnF/AvaK domain-containing protein [Chloroflexia bacterium]
MNKIKANMIVDCLGSRLGTVTAVRGSGAARVIEVRREGARADAAALHIPARLVAQVLENTVLLNVSCDEAIRMAESPDQQTTQLETVTAAASQTTRQAPVVHDRPAMATGRTHEMAGDSMTVPIVEETLVPVKQWREAGALEVRKTVRTVTQDLDVPVRYEEASVERVPINRVLADGETLAARQDGDTLIVPVVHEEVIVQKRRVLVEELRITKAVRTTTRHFSEPVRREEIAITHEGLEADTTNPPTAGH